MGRIEAVLFDFDDTLIDWSQNDAGGSAIYRRHIENVYQYLADRFAMPESETFFNCYQETIIAGWTEAKKTWAGVNFVAMMKQSLETIGLDLTLVDMDELLQAFDWQPVPGVVPFSDTVSTLTAVQAQGYKIGLVTNAMMPMWMRDRELTAYGILHFFDARVTSGDVGYMKPHPRIYQQVLDELDVSPERALFVGDRPANDIAGANEVGLISVLMDLPHTEYELDGVQPHYTIRRLGDLLPILEALEREESHEKTGTK